MGGEDLLDQGGARAGHADHQHRALVRLALPRKAREEVLVEHRDQPLDLGRESRAVEARRDAAAQRVRGLEVRERARDVGGFNPQPTPPAMQSPADIMRDVLRGSFRLRF